MKKTAFVHDRIAHEWGAEAVLKDLMRKNTHDEWVIFTYYSIQTRRRVDDKTYRIITALPRWLNRWFIICNTRKLFILSTLFDYRNLMFRFPLLTYILRNKIKKYNPSTVVISSFAAAKNIAPLQKSEIRDHKSKWYTISLYLHSPMQYIWENYEENIAKLRFPIKQLYQLAALYLRPWDKKKRYYDEVYFNSEYTERLAKKLYNLEWEVKYPALDEIFHTTSMTYDICNYYIFMGRLVRYVREIDKIIQLFNSLQLPLIIAGDGPDMTYAQNIAWPTIIFTGHISSVEEKKKLLQQARWYINLAKESFGIGTAEALCSGVPVFGYNAWATADLVDENNGVLVDKKWIKELKKGFEVFTQKGFNRAKIAKEAQKKFFSQ